MLAHLLIGLVLVNGQVQPTSSDASSAPVSAPPATGRAMLGLPSLSELFPNAGGNSQLPYSPYSPQSVSPPVNTSAKPPAASVLLPANAPLPYTPYGTQSTPTYANGPCPSNLTYQDGGCFFMRLWKAYCKEFKPSNGDSDDKKDANGDKKDETAPEPSCPRASPFPCPSRGPRRRSPATSTRATP